MGTGISDVRGGELAGLDQFGEHEQVPWFSRLKNVPSVWRRDGESRWARRTHGALLVMRDTLDEVAWSGQIQPSSQAR